MKSIVLTCGQIIDVPDADVRFHLAFDASKAAQAAVEIELERHKKRLANRVTDARRRLKRPIYLVKKAS